MCVYTAIERKGERQLYVRHSCRPDVGDTAKIKTDQNTSSHGQLYIHIYVYMYNFIYVERIKRGKGVRKCHELQLQRVVRDGLSYISEILERGEDYERVGKYDNVGICRRAVLEGFPLKVISVGNWGISHTESNSCLHS